MFCGISVVFWKQQQLWHLKNQRLTQSLTQNETLLRQLTHAQDVKLEKDNTILHSNLKSKIHAIDLVLHRIKKQNPNLQLQEAFSDISTITNSSLQLIEELGNTSFSPTLYALGFLPALNELAAQFNLKISVNLKPEKSPFPTNLSKTISLYALIKIWLEESAKNHQATEVLIDWEFNELNWRLTFKDNGKYISDPNNDNLVINQRLVALQAKIYSQEVNLSGRTIILVPNFFNKKH